MVGFSHAHYSWCRNRLGIIAFDLCHINIWRESLTRFHHSLPQLSDPLPSNPPQLEMIEPLRKHPYGKQTLNLKWTPTPEIDFTNIWVVSMKIATEHTVNNNLLQWSNMIMKLSRLRSKLFLESNHKKHHMLDPSGLPKPTEKIKSSHS